MKIKLLVADDHAVVREGVATILKGSDIQVVAEASTGNQAIERAMNLQPDVVLLDVRMPDTDGLALANVDSVDITVRGKGGHG